MVGSVRFNWVKTRSAWQEMEYRRAKRAQAIKEDLAQMDSVTATVSNAFQNKISGSANLAAEAALKRTQAAAKAKLEATSKQIDQAQALIETTQKSLSTTTTVNTVI